MADTDTNPCKPLPCGSQQEIVEPVAPMLFTLGIIFSPNLEHVYLIRRDNPDSQKGKLNGVGGKVEPGESLDACMAREAVEESGYSGLWTHFAIKEGHTRGWGAYECHLYYSIMPPGAAEPHTTEKQPIERIATKDAPLLREYMIPPLPLIIHAALEYLASEEHERFFIYFAGHPILPA